MKSKQQSPVWPYLGILACLFVLSITAPRAWKRMARQESLSHVLAARQSATADFDIPAQPTRTSDHDSATTVEPYRQKVVYETSDSAELITRDLLLDPPAVQPDAVHLDAVQPPAEPQPVPPAPEIAQEIS